MQTQLQSVISTAAASPRVATPRRLDMSPSGLTPPAKRPLDRASIQVANTGERPMSHEELTAGFYALRRKLCTAGFYREEIFVNGLRDCVVHHAELIDSVGKRSGELLVGYNLLGPKIEQLETETKQHLLKLEGGAADRIAESDQKIRKQLDVVVEEIDGKMKQQHAALSEIISAVASQSTGSTASSSHEFNISEMARNVMQSRADIEQLKLNLQIWPKVQEGMAEIRETVAKGARCAQERDGSSECAGQE